MGIFGNIMDKIFHHPKAQATSAASPAPAAAPAAAAPAAAPAPSAAPTQVDVGGVLTEMAAMKNGGGNYQTSIVDLLKLLDLDSSSPHARSVNFVGVLNGARIGYDYLARTPQAQPAIVTTP
ncbi:MAG: DUF3597 family protein, partial [Sphingomonas sp.]